DGDSASRGSGDLAIFRLHPFHRRSVAQGNGPVWGKLGLAFNLFPGFSDHLRVLVRSNDGRIRTVLEERASALFPVAWSGGGRELLIAEAPVGPTTSPFRAVLL